MTIELPTTVPLQAYLALAAILFCTGVWGLINSRNAVRVLMSIELMLCAKPGAVPKPCGTRV